MSRPDAPRVLRAVTLNLWGEQGPLQQRLALCSQGLQALAPDVVALQEVRQIADRLPNTAATLAAMLGYQHVYADASEWGGGQEGLAVLSRLPIVRAQHWELPHASSDRRILLRADVQHPAGEVAVFCTHLHYRMKHGVQREDQVDAIDQHVSAALEGPTPPRLALLMGDFNATPDSDEIRFLRGLHTLAGRRTYYQDAYARVHGADAQGYTWATRNLFARRLRWLDGDRRIDYIFVSPMARDGRGVIHDARVVLDEAAPADPAQAATLGNPPPKEGPEPLVFPSDHFGLLADVQVASD